MRRRDFVKTTTTGVIGGAYGLAGSQERARPLEPGRVARLVPGRYDETWWNRRPVRLVQTNLREIDARLDVDAYVRWMVEGSVNLVLLNVGGIVANYPTRLEFHYRNPFMEGDLVGDLITRLHERDIRVMGRFDFSKINETLAARRPDWLYVSAEDENVNYNGQVHVCPSRGYQQEYAFRILEEAITSYPLDAIFFNMVGYQTRDYSGNEYGQCRCEDCRRLFEDGSGRTRDEVANELFTRMHGYIRELDPDIVISTYTTVGVDMVASESSSSLSTDHEWTYSATDQVKRTLDSYTDLVPMNLLIGFLDIGFRHIATSPHIARVWQTQNMLHGGSLDYVFIGPAHQYQDRAFVPTLQELYRFHASHEELFTNLRSAGRVALVRGRGDEYRGLIKLLSEEHVIYDIISTDVIGTDRMPRPLDDYDAVVLGDVRDMSAELVALVDDYVRAGGKVLATGFSSVRTPEAGGGSEEGDDALRDPQTRIQLECLGVRPEFEFFPRSRSTYLNISAADKAALGEAELADFDLMMAYEDLMRVRPLPAARGYMNLIPSTMFGPPEKNYFLEDEITEYPGVVYHEYGGGRTVLVPWGLGAHYYAKGHHIHRAFFGAVLRNVLQVERSVETDAPHLVEVSHLTNRDGAFEWIGLINHTGQVGPTLGAAVPIRDIAVRLKPFKPAREVSPHEGGPVDRCRAGRRRLDRSHCPGAGRLRDRGLLVLTREPVGRRRSPAAPHGPLTYQETLMYIPTMTLTNVHAQDARAAAQLFHALSDETRLAVLDMLSSGEQCVCDLQSALDAAQSRLSFHLKVLKDAGLVTDRKEGRWSYYALDVERLAEASAILQDLATATRPPPSLRLHRLERGASGERVGNGPSHPARGRAGRRS